MLLESNHLTVIEGYIETCQVKTEQHRRNAKNALAWWNFLGIFNVCLTSAQALTMTIQSVYKSGNIEIAVTGAVFACVLAISSRVQMAFSFNALAIQHNQVSDDYDELIINLKMLLLEYNLHTHKTLVQRFISIQEKGHLQSVNECRYTKCFCN
jgi:hypothetical protein